MHNKGQLIYGPAPSNIKQMIIDINQIENGKNNSGSFDPDVTSISYWKDARFYLTQTMSSGYSENLWKFPDGRTQSFSSPWSITSPMTTLKLTVDQDGGGGFHSQENMGSGTNMIYFVLEDNSIIAANEILSSRFQISKEYFTATLPVSATAYAGSNNNGVEVAIFGGELLHASLSRTTATGASIYKDHSSASSSLNQFYSQSRVLIYGGINSYIYIYFPMGLYMGGKFIPIYFRNTIKYDSTDIVFYINYDYRPYYAPSGSTWQSFISNANYSKILNGNSEFSVYSSKIRYIPIYDSFLDGEAIGVDANKYIRTGSLYGSLVSPTDTIVNGRIYYA